MTVAIILPSRGLIFSETAQEIFDNVKDIPHKFFFAHELPIPDCFEQPLEKALFGDLFTHYWFVEEDMILPPDTLQTLLDVDEDVVTMDYPTTKRGHGSVFRDASGEVILSGTGCLLVKRQVFSRLKKPYFRSDIKWTIQNYGKFIKFMGTKSIGNHYGLHDVTFGIKLRNAGIPIVVHPRILGQRKLVALGKAGTNNGAHNIEEWTEVKPDYFLKEIQSYPVMPNGNLVTVRFTDNTLQNVSPAHAKKLMKDGRAERLPQRTVLIDLDEGIEL